MPTGSIKVEIGNVELDLFEELQSRVKENSEMPGTEGNVDEDIDDSDAEADEEEREQDLDVTEKDARRESMLKAIDFLLENHVEKINTRPQQNTKTLALHLNRSAVIHLWKRSNTRGGSFQLKKMNYVDQADISYNESLSELVIRLNVLKDET